MSEFEKTVIDLGSVAGLGLVWADKLPAISSAIIIVWTIIRIYETDTVKSIIRKLRGK